MAATRKQFGRSLILELGDTRIESIFPRRGMRVSFAVERDKTEIPNNCELAIWNLSRSTRSAIEQARELTCRLSAGYGPEPGQLFYGIVALAESKKDPNTGDWVLRVSAGDGQDKYGSAKISNAFARGTPVATVLKALVQATGLGVGNASQLTGLALPSGATELETAYVAHGAAVFELQVFADSLGLDWSFQDGQFVGAKNGEPYTSSGPLLSSKPGQETGLLEASLDAYGNVSGRAMLLEDLLPGVAFRVDGERAQGDFVCSATNHAGDTHDEQLWHVGFHGIPLGATSDNLLPPKQEANTQPTSTALVG